MIITLPDTSNGKKHSHYLGMGCARIVYDWSKTRVIKIALSDGCWSDDRGGIDQNKKEFKIYNKSKSKYLAKIYRHDKKFKWLISEKINVFKNNTQFCEYVGLNSEWFAECFYNIKFDKHSKLENDLRRKEINKTIKSIKKLVEKYNLNPCEFEEYNHWGIRKNGDLVLIDYGY